MVLLLVVMVAVVVVVARHTKFFLDGTSRPRFAKAKSACDL
jgi:hypothetical protein